MNVMERWTLMAALMPEGIEVIPDGYEALITDGDKRINVIYNDLNGSYVINGKTYHFKDNDFEFLNTLLVPIILQELDGNRRI